MYYLLTWTIQIIIFLLKVMSYSSNFYSKFYSNLKIMSKVFVITIFKNKEKLKELYVLLIVYLFTVNF
jgi:hypothetical protein